HVVTPIGCRYEGPVVAAERPEDGGCGGDRAVRMIHLPARALTDAPEPDSATVEPDDVLPVRRQAEIRTRLYVVAGVDRIAVRSAREVAPVVQVPGGFRPEPDEHVSSGGVDPVHASAQSRQRSGGDEVHRVVPRAVGFERDPMDFTPIVAA